MTDTLLIRSTATKSGVLRVVLVSFCLDVAISAIYLLNSALGRPIGDEFSRLVDLDEEANVSAWYSSVQMFFAGMILLALSLILWRRNRKLAFATFVLSAVIFLLSVDEVAGMHESIGYRLDLLLDRERSTTAFPITGIWMIVLGPPFVALLGTLLLWLVRYGGIGAGILSKFLSGFALFLVGALGIETLSNVAVTPAASAVRASLEELAEMMGMTVVLWASIELFWEQVRRHRVDLAELS